MKIIVTGACGAIGTALSLKLLSLGYSIIGIDNFISGTQDNLKFFDEIKNFTLINKDVCQINISNFKKIDHIFHLASLASPVKYEKFPLETIDANTKGTQKMLKIAQQNGATFTFASTSEIYGEPTVHPQSEQYNGNVNPCCLRSVYDEAKRLGETITNLYQEKFNVDTKIVRIFNTYSPYMAKDDGRVITNFMEQAKQNIPFTIYGNGNQTRSFQYVDDLVSGLISLMQITYHKPINLGNPKEITMLELAYKIAYIYNIKSKFVFKPQIANEPTRRCPDISLAKTVLNWQPEIDLPIGLNLLKSYME